jgi:hypothetical protein
MSFDIASVRSLCDGARSLVINTCGTGGDGDGFRAPSLLIPGDPMAIYRLLNEAEFSPRQIECLATAYESALRQIGLVDRSDPMTELVAKTIIDVARSGEMSPTSICSRALEELGIISRETPPA